MKKILKTENKCKSLANNSKGIIINPSDERLVKRDTIVDLSKTTISLKHNLGEPQINLSYQVYELGEHESSEDSVDWKRDKK